MMTDNSRNLKTKETYPDHVSGSTVGQTGYGIVALDYDAAGRVQRKTDQRGDTVTVNFDLAGRMTQRDYRTAANSPAGAIADSDVFTHNANGQTLTASSGRYNNVVAMAYDVAGRLQNESLTISGQTYTVGSQYDTRGQLWKQTYPDGKIVERLYHDDGQLHQVKYNGNLIDTRLYDDGGRLEKSTYGNGVATDFTYFDDNNTESITIKDASQSLIDSFAYSYDSNKNVTGETRGGVMSGFSWNTNNSGAPGYDDDDRLTYWKHSDASQTQSWNLSLVGNWNSTTINGTQQNRTHNSVHELTAVNSTALTYDVKGNLTTNTNSDTYTWDFDNRMSGADTDGNSVDDVLYEYDALGRRVRKNNGTTNTVFVLAGWQVVAEYASGAAPASPSEQYVYASYIDEPILKTGTGGIVYYSRNRQYSITALTNSTGALIEYYAYDSHGKLAIFDASATLLSATQYANPYTYTARRYEPETNLYYFRARYLDAALGRFIGRDPVGYVDGANMYREYFVLNTVDPSGLEIWDSEVVGARAAEFCCTLKFANGREKKYTISGRLNMWVPVSLQDVLDPKRLCGVKAALLLMWSSSVKTMPEVTHARANGCKVLSTGRFGICTKTFDLPDTVNASERCITGCFGAQHSDIGYFMESENRVYEIRSGKGGGGSCKKVNDGLGSFCPMNVSRYGKLENGVGIGKSCRDASTSDIYSCLSTTPEVGNPFDNAFNNCHISVRAYAQRCCLDWTTCMNAIPSNTYMPRNYDPKNNPDLSPAVIRDPFAEGFNDY